MLFSCFYSPIQEHSPEHSKIAPSPSSCSIFPTKSSEIVEDVELENAEHLLAACKLSETLKGTALDIEDPWGVKTQPFTLEEENRPEVDDPGKCFFLSLSSLACLVFAKGLKRCFILFKSMPEK